MTAPPITPPQCPACNVAMIQRTSLKYIRRNGMARLFWACPNWPGCVLTIGAHPDGQPLGTPADEATKVARVMAHEEFDKLWKSRRMSRHEAYGLMQYVMGMTEEQAHIGLFNIEQCQTLIDRLKGLGVSDD